MQNMSSRAQKPARTPGPAESRTMRLVGVGVGPGDPELITLKALKILAAAAVILVPTTERSGDDPGRAELIVTQSCPEASSAIQRIPFSMADRQGVSGRRKQAWLDSAEAAVDAFNSGAEVVVFATVGDPSVYSTFSYLAAHVVEQLPEVTVEVVPGITAMQALAASSRTPLVEGTETLALVPVTAGLETLERVLATVDTVVAYKGGRHLPEVIELLKSKHRAGVLGVQIGLPDEQIVTLDDVAEGHRAPYFSTVLAPAHRSGTAGGRL